MNPDLNGITRALDRLVAVQQKGPIEYISTIAVVLTLLVLVWYTIETYLLRKAAQVQTNETAKLLGEARRQNETSMQPIVTLQSGYFHPHERFNGLVIRNLGFGPAFNVSTTDVQLPGKSAIFEHTRTLGPGQHDFVAVSGLREPKVDSAGAYDDGKIRGAADLLNGFQATPDSVVAGTIITYTSATGRKYRTKIMIDVKSTDAECFIAFDGLEAE